MPDTHHTTTNMPLTARLAHYARATGLANRKQLMLGVGSLFLLCTGLNSLFSPPISDADIEFIRLKTMSGELFFNDIPTAPGWVMGTEAMLLILLAPLFIMRLRAMGWPVWLMALIYLPGLYQFIGMALNLRFHGFTVLGLHAVMYIMFILLAAWPGRKSHDHA